MRLCLFASIAVILTSFVGCSSSEPQPQPLPVTGTVTMGGKPLASGRIAFRGKDQPPIGGEIVNGKYECRAWPGPTVVEVRAYRSVKRAQHVPGMSDTEEINYIPARYNDESTLHAEVSPDGTNSFNFELSSR